MKKLPYPITPARVTYENRDSIPIRLRHITAALLVLPAIAGAAYVVAKIIFSIPS